MKKLFWIFLICTSCSNYIVDPRGSKEPKEILRDEIECKKLIRDNLNFIDRFILHDKLIKNCLQGRGHSILN